MFEATAVYAIYNVGASLAIEVFDTYYEASDWLEAQAAEYEISTGLDDFWTNGSNIKEL